ncbi:MAG: hypothetical protein LBD68_00155 [Zoogloeaceae bacterium]|nr:hypothetical protein [Zoogloeaceae bacterium]
MTPVFHAERESRAADAAKICPLHGIPLAIKGNIDLVGIPTAAACSAFFLMPEKARLSSRRLLVLDATWRNVRVAIALGKTGRGVRVSTARSRKI